MPSVNGKETALVPARPRRLRLIAGAALVALLTAAPAAAHAATRVASPDGANGASCQSQDPCSLDTAITGAASGDEVVIEPGDYNVSSVSESVPLNIHGVAGQPRPRILGTSSSAAVLALKKSGTTLSHVFVSSSGSGQALEFQGGVADDVVLTASAGDTVKLVASTGQTVLRDALVTNTGTGDGIKVLDGSNAQGGASAVLRNVTVVAEGSGANAVRSTQTNGTTNALDVIARGGAGDLNGSGGSITASYSDFRPGLSPGVHDAGHNVASDPGFVDEAAGDFHLTAASRDIDAGTTDGFSGTTDPDGNARVIGPAADIGAYETTVSAAPRGSAGAGGGRDGDAGNPSGLPLISLTDPLAGLTVPAPRYGHSIDVAPAAGRVLVLRPGSRHFSVVTEGVVIPVGSVINARKGAVRLVSARDAHGRAQAGIFGGSTFQVAQQRHGGSDTVLRLRGGSFTSCPRGGAGKAGKAVASSAAVSRRRANRSQRVIRQLWGRDQGGKFQTHGRFAAALVRGTTWLTQDRCDGTLVRVTHGVVVVRSTVTGRRVRVTAGHSYLARGR